MHSPFPPRCRSLFEAEKCLAAGAFGSVYLAKQIGLERPAAVKLLHDKHQSSPMALKRFVREAKIAATLNHPNIVQMYDHDVEDGVPWIAYEFIEGGAVDDLFHREAP